LLDFHLGNLQNVVLLFALDLLKLDFEYHYYVVVIDLVDHHMYYYVPMHLQYIQLHLQYIQFHFHYFPNNHFMDVQLLMFLMLTHLMLHLNLHHQNHQQMLLRDYFNHQQHQHRLMLVNFIKRALLVYKSLL
jgi:hypothetical protein